MKLRKMLEKATAVIMASVLMLGSCMLASAETGNVTGGGNATSDTTENWCFLEGIEEIKAGETATINVVTKKTVYMSAVSIYIKLNDEKVAFASEKNASDSYEFFNDIFWSNQDYLQCNYLEDKMEVRMAGICLYTNGLVKVEQGNVIASIKVKAKADLVKDDVIATLTRAELIDEVQGLRYEPVDGNFGECVVKESEKNDVVIGDVNGDGTISAEDALIILKHVVGLETLTGDALINADVNGDKAISAEDALDVLKRVVGLLDKFAAEV